MHHVLTLNIHGKPGNNGRDSRYSNIKYIKETTGEHGDFMVYEYLKNDPTIVGKTWNTMEYHMEYSYPTIWHLSLKILYATYGHF